MPTDVGMPTAGEPDFRGRSDRETRAISVLDHPHICTLYDAGHDNDVASHCLTQSCDANVVLPGPTRLATGVAARLHLADAPRLRLTHPPSRT